MILAARRHPGEPVAAGTARVDRRTKNLVKRLQPGEIAVIDHEDIDRMAAEQLVAAQVGAVVNAAACISGRYPTEGPLVLAAANIPIVEGVGSEVLARVREGQVVRVDGGEVWVGNDLVASGIRQTLASVEHDYEAAKRQLGDELGRF